MSQRFKAAQNVNSSKNTRLDVAGEFAHYRFGRDQLAHVSRYLFIVEQIEEMAKGGPLSILDIGCGNVYIARCLAASSRMEKSSLVSYYAGLDMDDKALNLAEETLPKCMPIALFNADITNGGLSSFSDKQFNLVICTEVLEHIQPNFVPLVLKEIKRVGKKALISTPNFTGGSGRLPEDHVKEWDTDELAAVMEKCGITIRRKIGIFSNLNKVRDLCKQDKKLAAIYDFLEPRMDSNFLSICMARFIGTNAQNVMYICDL